MIGWMIVACEIGFWIFLLAGLFVRYILGAKKLGVGLMLFTPIIDLILIIATVLDIQRGAEVTVFHGLAAIYIGITVAYGHSMIKWADERFAYRFAGGPKPAKLEKFGTEHAKRERAGWLRHFIAYVIGNLILAGMILFIGDSSETSALFNLSKTWTTVLVIDFAISFSYTLWPRKEPKNSKHHS